jgi:formylglycine-generating enzyme required for sulfatase activity
MFGKVRQWCYDYYESNYYHNSPKDNPKGPSNGSKHVYRGDYNRYGGNQFTRITNRDYSYRDEGSCSIGFRVVIDV